MPYSYLSHLRCSKTGDIYDADQPQQLSQVGAPLLASYDLEALKKVWHPAALLGRPATLWRYHEL
ncbi:MAG: threonine synthase, partial [Aeromonas salmonicida]